jgi:type IV pilus assembly protein PilB
MPVKLGELLLKENMVTPQQLQEALTHQKMNGGKLGKAFVSLGYVRDEEITSLLSRQYGVPSINLDHFEVDPAIIKIIPAETSRKYQILPLSRSGATLTIAMADPTNVFAMDDIKFMTGYNVEPVVASETSLDDAIEKYYGSTRSLQLKSDMGYGGGGGGASMGAAGLKLGEAPSLREMMEGPSLSFDDMASVGLSEVDIDALG